MADFSRWQRDNLESLAAGLTKERLSHVATIQEMKAALQQCLVWIEADEETHGRKFGAGNAVRAALEFRSLGGKSP
jgi:hypothetical protein